MNTLAIGLSINDWQTLAVRATLSSSQFELVFLPQETIRPNRVGYLYVYIEDAVDPSAQRQVLYTPIYEPGIFLVLPSSISLADFSFTFVANWDTEDLLWTLNG